MKRSPSLLLPVIITLIFSTPSALLQAAQPGPTYTTLETIGLRVEPKPTARVIATLERNVRVRVNSCKEGWCSVTTRGMTGYVVEKYLAMSAPPKQGPAGHKN